MLKFTFEYLTDSFSLLENPIDDCIIMGAVGVIAFLIAYNIVGWFYQTDIIEGGEAGHILHWIIRLIVFVIIYYAVATAIRIYYWIAGVPVYVWWIVAAAAVTVSILIVSIKLIIYRNEHKREKERV